MGFDLLSTQIRLRSGINLSRFSIMAGWCCGCRPIQQTLSFFYYRIGIMYCVFFYFYFIATKRAKSLTDSCRKRIVLILWCLIVYFWNLSLSLPNDLNRNPLKTRIPAKAEATMVCSWGIPITNATTNVMAAAIEPSGIHTLTASADLFLVEVIHHVILIYFYTMGQPSNNEILWRTSVEYVALRKIRHVELVFVDPSSNPCPWWLGRR